MAFPRGPARKEGGNEGGSEGGSEGGNQEETKQRSNEGTKERRNVVGEVAGEVAEEVAEEAAEDPEVVFPEREPFTDKGAKNLSPTSLSLTLYFFANLRNNSISHP